MAAEEGKKKNKMVVLRSSDGQEFVLPEEAATKASPTLRSMAEDYGRAEPPRVPAAGRALSRVVEYCRRHFAAAGGEDDDLQGALERFDAELIGGANDDGTIFDLTQTAHHLGVGGLVDLCCKRVAEEITGKTVEQIRARFRIVNDYTEEEEAAVREENSWAFDD